MSKYYSLIDKTDQQIIESCVYALDLSEDQMINIAETLEHIIYMQPSFFSKYSRKEKISMMLVFCTILDTFMDVNELAFDYLVKAFDCFNNNIYYVVKGGKV